ncbi:MAG: hypothetical protein ACLFV2_04465 [Desulfurivibrionaceae bacterium]
MKTKNKEVGYKKAGIVGVPPLTIIKELGDAGTEIYDLDEPQQGININRADSIIPRVYCAIIRTVVVNALYLDLDVIYMDTGPGKCDSSLNTSFILEKLLDIPVIRTKNHDHIPYGYPLCRSHMPLTEKIRRITGLVTSTSSPAQGEYPPSLPTAGFWGVPPRNLSLLEPFPATTHIYGWTRCMENKTPADTELELYYNPDIPTVFFAQSFCPKTSIAKFLASRHPSALYLDVDTRGGSSAKAKIEAFLELSGVKK